MTKVTFIVLLYSELFNSDKHYARVLLNKFNVKISEDFFSKYIVIISIILCHNVTYSSITQSADMMVETGKWHKITLIANIKIYTTVT